LEKDFLEEDMSYDVYYRLSDFDMKRSLQEATYVAAKQAKRDVELKEEGVYVIAIESGIPISIYFEAGDIITSVNGVSTLSKEEFLAVLATLEPTQSLTFDVLRGGKHTEITIDSKDHERPIDLIHDAFYMDTNLLCYTNFDIGYEQFAVGPSAGLMITLEILNQLVPEDISKGYSIAGTGTIDAEGKVGAIGGVNFKVIGAHESNADIFFVPAEMDNDVVAMRTAKKVQSTMKIVPVRTIEDALEYLQSLPAK
jgi:PDZ domain-containing protein